MPTMLLNTQLGIFFKNPIQRPDLLTRKISDDFSAYFDSAPINLPFPANILDFPIAQLKSSNNSWQINVSRMRADIIFSPEENKNYTDITTELERITEILIKLADEARSQKVEISRITSIGNFIKLTNTPVKDLQDLYFKEENTKLSEMVIRFNNPITEKSLTYNNIIQYETGLFVNIKDGLEKSGIIIMRDFNTEPKKKDSFTNEDINDFIAVAKKYSHTPEFDKITKP